MKIAFFNSTKCNFQKLGKFTIFIRILGYFQEQKSRKERLFLKKINAFKNYFVQAFFWQKNLH